MASRPAHCIYRYDDVKKEKNLFKRISPSSGGREKRRRRRRVGPSLNIYGQTQTRYKPRVYHHHHHVSLFSLSLSISLRMYTSFEKKSVDTKRSSCGIVNIQQRNTFFSSTTTRARVELLRLVLWH